jgi:protein-S-isoprenylcysteine O-methyltransferase Ste14
MGFFLVALQFSLLLLLAKLAATNVALGQIPVAALLLALCSLALMGWTLLHNRIGNFNFRPMPKPKGQLVTSGPYQWIRHPMYTAAMLGASAMVWTGDFLPGLLLWFALANVLLLKSRLEERWMLLQHPDYANYILRSKRFIPGLI